jgi:hypothetical protein
VDGRWEWGRYDPAGPAGFSAEVSFDKKGKNERVRINWSTDTEEPLPGEDDYDDYDEVEEDSSGEGDDTLKTTFWKTASTPSKNDPSGLPARPCSGG